jgi:hypothetical protein
MAIAAFESLPVEVSYIIFTTNFNLTPELMVRSFMRYNSTHYPTSFRMYHDICVVYSMLLHRHFVRSTSMVELYQ